MRNPVFTTVANLSSQIEQSQQKAIEQASDAIIQCFDNGGIIQAWGSGHSLAGAMEICHRAGGFIPTKRINEPSMGQYESIEGVGSVFMKKVDVRANDVVFIISNSGRNPLVLDMALGCKAKGATVIAITALQASKSLTSKHSSGKRLFEVADIVLDNCTPLGDCCIPLENFDSHVIGLSMITTSIVIQATMYRTMEKMIALGKQPLVYKSQNIDGCREENEQLEKLYTERLNRI